MKATVMLKKTIAKYQITANYPNHPDSKESAITEPMPINWSGFGFSCPRAMPDPLEGRHTIETTAPARYNAAPHPPDGFVGIRGHHEAHRPLRAKLHALMAAAVSGDARQGPIPMPN